jgi:DNA-binding MarR family transcriptional regulator
VETTNWLDPEELRAWRSYIEATTRVRHACTTALQAETGLTLDDYAILVALGEGPDNGIRMSELADTTAMARSGLTYRVDRLAKLGYVCRRACPDDGRSTYAVLTPEGQAGLDDAARCHVTNVRRFLVDHMTREQFTTLGFTLEPVAEALRPS